MITGYGRAANRAGGWIVALIASLLAGCGRGPVSSLDAAGPQAARIAESWWFMFAVTGVVWAIVVALLLYGVFGKRDGVSVEPGEEAAPERGKTRAVVAGTLATVIILIAIVVHSVSTGRAITTMPLEDPPLTVRVTGHQWWWEVRYADPERGWSVVTANEIHLPVGEPVLVEVRTADVLHSFWIPNLHGKIDLFPNRYTRVWLQADEPGEYRGECAEFCGLQHAKMAFVVVADRPADFEEWARRQQRPAPPPADSLSRAGQRVFLEGPCALCHAIRGTDARGGVAPDLTHLASRRTIAAGTLPNTRGHLAGWILDPHGVKPGVFMPPAQLEPDDLQALLAYLETLE